MFVHNDAEFTEKDWQGIRMLSQSIKCDDQLKVGQFGLGFKSIFHFTGELQYIILLVHVFAVMKVFIIWYLLYSSVFWISTGVLRTCSYPYIGES